MGDTVFSADWYKDFLSFQRNPKTFIDTRKLTRDDFCMDILKDLYSDDVESQCKCHLLLSLQQHQTYLIQDNNLLEQVVGSLQNLYVTLESSANNHLLKSYIIITITTLLLTPKNLDVNINKMCMTIRNLLLGIIFQEQKENFLQSLACQCLVEMETFYPCIVKDEISTLLLTVKNSEFLQIQNYVVLLSLSLKHAMDQQSKEKSKSVAIEDMKMKSPQRKSSSFHGHNIQVHHYVSSILDTLPFISEASAYLVFKNLIHIVENTPYLLLAIFKPFLSKLVMSSDVLHFHLAFNLLETFGSDLFNSLEEKQLLRQLLVSLKQPSISSSHRLLYLDWLQTIFMKKTIFSISIPRTCIKVILPSPFDGPYTQEKKIKIICMYFTMKQENADSDLLMNSVMGLKRQSLLYPPVTTVSSFFRSLFSIYTLLESTAARTALQKVILEVMSSSPHLSPFVLDFLKHVSKENTECSFSNTIFAMLVEHVVNLTPKQCAHDFSSLLPILEAAVMEGPDVCKPQTILRQLNKVLVEPSLLARDNWVIGHKVLAVCSSILKNHDVGILYHDLGELLNLVMKNINDCDCHDRAKQYYAALTALPQTQIKELFRSKSMEKKGNISLSNIVTGNEVTYFSKNIKLSKPVFELVRLERRNLSFPRRFMYDNYNNEEGLSKQYMSFINSNDFQPVVKLPFLLRHAEDCPNEFSTIFCVVITIQTSLENTEIKDIEVPVLKMNFDDIDKGALPIDIEFIPKSAKPIILYPRAEFTSSNGSSYRFQLPNITLELEDLFSLIPVVATNELKKKQLFEELWKDLQSDQENRCLSAFCLKVSEENLESFIEANWKDFLISQEGSSTYSVAIYLPPTSHLLMKIAVHNNSGFATTLTENKVLPCLSCYIDGVINKQAQ